MNAQEKFVALLPNTPVRKGDVIFLAEGDGYTRVPYAAKLYQEGFAQLIATVGGATTRDYGSFPSGELKIELLKLGVPESAIYCEEVALHTKAEADRMLELARERGWKTILLVTSPHHQYRAFLTWLKSMKNAGLKLVLVNAPAPLSWFDTNPWGRRADLLEGEWERIEAYQTKGDVASFEEGIEYLQWTESQQ